MVGVKDKVMRHFKTNTAKDYSKPKRVNNVYRGRRKKTHTKKQKYKRQSKDSVIKNIRNIFKIKKAK